MAPLPGIQLRSAREARGLTLRDAAHETKIPMQRLTWLEQDNFAAFGSLTYARAFLKIYSAYLNIDASDLLNELPSTRLGGPGDYRYLTENHGSWVVNSRRQLQSPDAGKRIRSFRSPMVAGVTIFFLMLVGTGIWGHHVSQSSTHLKEEAPPLTTAPTKPEIISMKVSSEPVISADPLKSHPVTNTHATHEAGLRGRLQ